MRLSAFSGTFGHLRAERLGARLGAMSQMSTMRRSASATELRRPAAAPHAAAATAAAPGPPTPALVGRHRLALHFRGHRLALVPSSLWGSASLAVQLTQPATRVLPRSASVVAQAFSAAAATAPPSTPPPGPVSEDHPKALAEALAWRPQLGAAEDAACLLGGAAVCAGVYALTAPATAQPLYALGMALLYALLVAAGRTWLLERRYRAFQRSERELAAADSLFLPVSGVQLHYKRCTPTGQPRAGIGAADSCGADAAEGGGGGSGGAPPLAVHCLHGFGASAYSWSFVQQALADTLPAVVTAHDMPGFGLSQRPRSSAFYTLHWNGEAARQVMDAELAQAQQGPPASDAAADGIAAGGGGLQPLSAVGNASSASSMESMADGLGGVFDSSGQASPGASGAAEQQAQQAQQQPKRILVGHSMGGAAVAEAVISQPEGIAALVLVAPAIVALWLGPPPEAAGDPVATGLAVVEELVSAEDEPGELRSLRSTPSNAQLLARSPSTADAAAAAAAARSGVGARVLRGGRVLLAVARALLFLGARALLAAVSPLLTVLLRRLVRDKRFWERGLASAWHDGRRVTRAYIDAYRSGQLVRGWEGGMLRFVAARFAEKHGFWGSIREAVQGTGHLTQAERLAQVARRHGIRILLVHGASDALVPAANSRRLAALLPGAELVVFEGCGHMPHEECPDQFVQTVQTFVAGLDSGSSGSSDGGSGAAEPAASAAERGAPEAA